MMAQRVNVTDRAQRYRAQKNVTGPKLCVLCGSRTNIDVMHLDGNESHGEPANLAYGCRSCNGTLAAAFKAIGAGRPTNQYNPAKGDYPTFQQYAWAVSSGARQYYPNSTKHESGVKDEAGAVIHATPKHKRIEYAKRIASAKRYKARANPWPFSSKGRSARDTTPASGGIAASLARAKKRPAVDRASIENKKFLERQAKADKKEQKKYDLDHAALEKHYAKGGTLAEFLKSNPARLKRGCRANPSVAAADAYEEFHGHASRELVTVKKKIHSHEHLAAAGVLTFMVVRGIDGQVHNIEKFKGALLCFNESKTQLFIEGGDQSINLEDFGIHKPHERETLGRLQDIDYDTRKDHLGDEGGQATYTHRFRTTNKGGKHVTIKFARYPDLVYEVLNEQLLFSGGSYTIRAEGIDV